MIPSSEPGTLVRHRGMMERDDLGTNSPRIAFCTSCMNRLKHLQRTLPQNLADNVDYANALFVVLDYGDVQGVSRWIEDSFDRELEAGRLVCYRFPEPKYFHMAHAKNMAHRCGLLEHADVLVNLDADNFTGRGFAAYLGEAFGGDKRIFMRTGDSFKSVTRGLGGRIAARSWDFAAIGGYDEVFAHWSPDDKDFALRLKKWGLSQLDIEPDFLSKIDHSDEERVENYDASITVAQIAKGLAKRQNLLAGRENLLQVNIHGAESRIGCGTVYRNFSDRPTAIHPLSASLEKPPPLVSP